MIKRWRLHHRPDDGAAAVELVILAPVLIAMIAFAVMAMRIEVANESIDSAAHDAARAASISRNATDAQNAATTAANTTLADDGLNCMKLTVTVTTDGFSVPVGQLGLVTANVTCIVDLSDLAIPGLPGSRTLSSTFTSDIDRYGGRS